jgi:hypothetical protein
MVKRVLLVGAGLLTLGNWCFGGVIVNGSFGFESIGGSVTYSPNSESLATATSVTIPTPNGNTNCGSGTIVCEQITSILPMYLGNTNDFSSAGGHTPLAINDDVTFNSYTFDLTFTVLPTFFFTTQRGNRFTFVAASGQESPSTLGSATFLNVAYTGEFTDAGGLYSPAVGNLSLSFTQTGGAAGPVTYSGTFTTPPSAASLPEPVTVALAGSALVCVGLLGRKRVAR